MPQGKVTINGMMINLGAVNYFNKVERLSKKCNKDSVWSKERYDYGIEFIFKGGSRQTVWWFAFNKDYSYCNSLSSTEHQRNNAYNKLSLDFNIRTY